MLSNPPELKPALKGNQCYYNNNHKVFHLINISLILMITFLNLYPLVPPA